MQADVGVADVRPIVAAPALAHLCFHFAQAISAWNLDNKDKDEPSVHA